MNLVTILSEWWELIVVVATGIGGVIGWRKQQRSASALLLDEYDELKKRIIILIKREVTHADALAESQRFLRHMKTICPKCYQQALDELNNLNSSEGGKSSEDS